MRLINTTTFELEEYFGSNIPKYAILSHAWGNEEVSFQDWANPTRRIAKAGYLKIDSACRQARRDGLDYLWVDTNCIDKSSSAELTEAINSMFTWYGNALICYAYLEDVPGKSFENSRWFTRGWTLQELLAPSVVNFYDDGWTMLGTKENLATKISNITGIDKKHLVQPRSVTYASVATRMNWISRRETTREEDMAYCMLGIFDINMPLLYGEGRKAFMRLQEEIIRVSDDHTIFCWTWDKGIPGPHGTMLSPSPLGFSNSAEYNFPRELRPHTPYSITNVGLSIRLPILKAWSYHLAILEAYQHGARSGIALKGLLDVGRLQRMEDLESPVCLPGNVKAKDHDLIISSRGTRFGHYIPRQPFCNVGVLVLFIGNVEMFHDCGSYPPDQFDQTRSIFQFNDDQEISVGFLRLCSKSRRADDLIIFFGYIPASKSKWLRRCNFLCHVMPSWLSNLNEGELAQEFKYIKTHMASGGYLPARFKLGVFTAVLTHSQIKPIRETRDSSTAIIDLTANTSSPTEERANY
ncbi:heterokaryon incompatibility protein-domain-containing protein [Ilyonectria sp. MPI-CAGE-AT-0026]|nr:heterokaryon incompatibility protein-domain-containing protein [Ilyonectria sp. MPI-CAGE-AT-0026]